jgi:hypothetical protein
MLGRRPYGKLIPRRLLVSLVKLSGQVSAACWTGYGTLVSGRGKMAGGSAEVKAEEKKPLLISLDEPDDELS